MGLDCCRDIGEDVAGLLPAGLDHRQHRLDKAAATRALRAEGQLTPDDRVPQGALTGVVGRLDLLLQECPQPLPVLVQLADLFGSEKPVKKYITLVQGCPVEDEFEIDAKLSPHPVKLGLMRVDPKHGKKSKTKFSVLEKFASHTLLQCEPLTGRTHQIRIHLRHAGVPIVGDQLYGGKPLWLSRLKPNYRLKPGKEERPLMARVALHAEQLELNHPVTNQPLVITAAWPKDLTVAVKYLRQFAGA